MLFQESTALACRLSVQQSPFGKRTSYTRLYLMLGSPRRRRRRKSSPGDALFWNDHMDNNEVAEPTIYVVVKGVDVFDRNDV